MKDKTDRVNEILDILKEEYPDAGCALKHRNVFELVVCVVLSAQTTDVSVNKVTRGGSKADIEAGITVRETDRGLFDLYPDAESLAEASQEDVMEIIHTIGMYKTKSSNIIKLAKALCEKHEGKVPDDYDALVSLPGVGRKTANVVLAVGFGHQRIAVDTHVFRVSRRIGLAGISSLEEAAGSVSPAKHAGKETLVQSTDKEECNEGAKAAGAVGNAKAAKTAGNAKAAGAAENAKAAKTSGNAKAATSAKAAGAAEVLATEAELMKNLPENRWTEAHHSLIWHGRNCCTARNPKCGTCPISSLCSHGKENQCINDSQINK